MDLTYAGGGEFFLRCTGNRNQRGWGSVGENGADCVFLAIDQEMAGDVIWDSASKLDFYMTGGSSLRGAFLRDESCAGSGGDGTATLTIGAGSRWVVTGDSTLIALHNAGSITDAEGNTVTVKGTDGAIYTGGTSAYTVTVNTYDTEADTDSAPAVTSFEDAQVNTGSQESAPGGAGGPDGAPGNGREPPAKPDGESENGQEPPAKPDGGQAPPDPRS